MRQSLRLALLAAAFALGSIAFGWWSAALIGVLWGWLGGSGARDRVWYTTLVAGAAALIGWSAVLGWTMVTGETGSLLASLSSLFGIPWLAFPVASVAIGILLGSLGAWSGTGIPSHQGSPPTP